MKATRYTPEMAEYYTSKGLWTSETWPDTYERNARLYPDKEAFVSYERGNRTAMTWAEFNLAVKMTAANPLNMPQMPYTMAL